MTTYYKTLRTGRRGTHTEYVWPEPGTWTESVEGDLVACGNGYHVVTAEQLLGWISDEVWEVEAEDVQDGGDKAVCRRARLVRQVMGPREVRLFAADCAERVLPIFEAERPEDDRPRKAIVMARRYADGEATAEELAAAWVTAGAAERDWQVERLHAYLDKVAS